MVPHADSRDGFALWTGYGLGPENCKIGVHSWVIKPQGVGHLASVWHGGEILQPLGKRPDTERNFRGWGSLPAFLARSQSARGLVQIATLARGTERPRHRTAVLDTQPGTSLDTDIAPGAG